MQTRAAKRKEPAQDRQAAPAKRRKASGGSAGESRKPAKEPSGKPKKRGSGPGPAPTQPEADQQAPQPPAEAPHNLPDMSRRASRGEQEERVSGRGQQQHVPLNVCKPRPLSWPPASPALQDDPYNRNYSSAGRWACMRGQGGLRRRAACSAIWRHLQHGGATDCAHIRHIPSLRPPPHSTHLQCSARPAAQAGSWVRGHAAAGGHVRHAHQGG